VLSAQKVGNDTLLEIAFENTGTKKLMANYAKLTV
jgi:DNA helicase-2/ATP-dependent DNA helicase PcrA